jgi:hypothetical protein
MQYPYGLPPEEHADRLPAWTTRLRSAVAARDRARQRGDAAALKRAQEDVWFWVGRLTCDVLSSGADPAAAPARQDAVAAIIAAGGQVPAYGYPGVTGQRLPDTGAVNKTRIDGKPYLCVSYEVEKRQVQPLRLAAFLVAAPLIVYAGHRLRKKDDKMLGYATQAAGLAVAAWSGWVWSKAAWEMRTEP